MTNAWYLLELIVNTTTEGRLSVVMLELKRLGWSWEFVEVQIVPPEDDDDEEGVSEWMVLSKARRIASSAAA